MTMKKKILLVATLCLAALMLTSCAKKHDCHFKGTVKSFYDWGYGYEPIKTVITVTVEGDGFYQTYEKTCDNGVLQYDIAGYDLKEGSYNVIAEGYINIQWDNGYTEYVSDRVTQWVYVTQDGTVQNDFKLYLE